MEDLAIGSVPCEEECEQVGKEYRPWYAILECKQFIKFLIRKFGPPPDGAYYAVTENLHDFGTYHEVAIRFDENDKEASDYAFHVEAHVPSHWDDEDREALATTNNLTTQTP